LPIQRIADQHVAISSLFVGLAPSAAALTEVIEHKVCPDQYRPG
jgi:hypothetical protein